MMDIGEAVEEVLRMIDVRSFTNQGHKSLRISHSAPLASLSMRSSCQQVMWHALAMLIGWAWATGRNRVYLKVLTFFSTRVDYAVSSDTIHA